MEVTNDHLQGKLLYGNDLTGEALEQWYADEENGFADLATNEYANAEGGFSIGTKAFNRAHGALIPQMHFDTCLAMGCANGEDVLNLGKTFGRIIAIEPGRKWWTDKLGDVEAEFRAPTLSGDIELPNHSADIAIALGVLHHVATVEHVISEMARVLKPGGWMLIREPITSMGDFRQPRPGLTKNERGIPRPLMEGFVQKANLRLKTVRPCSFQAINRLGKLFQMSAYDSPPLVKLDEIVSQLTSFNARYWRPRLIDKIAPTSVVYVAQKPLDSRQGQNSKRWS